MDEALAAGQESIRLVANNVERLVNLSLVFVDTDDQKNAIVCLLRAIGLKHDYAEAHLALAQTLLAMGEFDPGWKEYEWRNQVEAGRTSMPAMTSAPWNGMKIPASRLLLVGDQGYGDTIQFARYISMAAERCQELILGCSTEMGRLLASMPGVSRYCCNWADVPPHAAHCRLSSLPYLFHTQLETIPRTVPYLRADPARIAHWRTRLGALLPAGRKRTGIRHTVMVQVIGVLLAACFQGQQPHAVRSLGGVSLSGAPLLTFEPEPVGGFGALGLGDRSGCVLTKFAEA